MTYGRADFLGGLSLDALLGVINDSPSALIAVDTEGIIREENTRAPGMFGYESLIGLPVEQLVPPVKRAVHHSQREMFLRNPSHRPMGLGLSLEGQRQDGVSFPLDISIAPARDGSGYVWAWITSLTERIERMDLARVETALTSALQTSVDNLPIPPDNTHMGKRILQLQIAILVAVAIGLMTLGVLLTAVN